MEMIQLELLPSHLSLNTLGRARSDSHGGLAALFRGYFNPHFHKLQRFFLKFRIFGDELVKALD